MKYLIKTLLRFKQWILSIVIKRFSKKYKYEGWKGTFTSHYFNHLENGEWVEISKCKYIQLNSKGYTVRKTVL